MHEAIIKKFKKYYIFGFTGTPIFEENAGKNYGFDKASQKAVLKTTQSTFGDCLHSYTILNAIKDKNVLPFKVSYHSTMKQRDSKECQVQQINTEEALMSKERIQQIVSYILENFNRHTKRQNAYQLKNQRKQGFNAIFATASVDFAKKYYAEFARQIKAGYCHSERVQSTTEESNNIESQKDISPVAQYDKVNCHSKRAERPKNLCKPRIPKNRNHLLL